MNDRIAALQRMLERNPDDVRARFGLAAEYERLGEWAAVVEQLNAYLAAAQDEGNAYGRLARAYLELGRTEDARVAYQAGIAAAAIHGHPTMAGEFEDALQELDH